MSWDHVVRRLIYYLKHPRLLFDRLGRYRIGSISVAYWLYATGYYFRHPRLISDRLRRFNPLRRALGLQVLPTALQFDAASVDDSIATSPHALANEYTITALRSLGRNPESLRAASKLLQRAFSLVANPTIAIHLANVLIRSNRNAEALEVYHTALRAAPKHRQLHHNALAQAMRHAGRSEVLAICDALLAQFPGDVLATHVLRIYETFPYHVASLEASIAAHCHPEESRPKLLIGCAAWGRHHAKMYTDYLLSSLLAEGNLPAIADRYDIHLILFTTAGEIPHIKKTPQFQEASKFAGFHLELFDETELKLTGHSDQDISNSAKFSLMSAAHYAVVETARRLNGLASVFGADNVLSDHFMSNAAAALTGDVDVVATPGFRLYAHEILPALSGYRTADGHLQIPPEEFAKLLVRFIPEPTFVDAEIFTSFPLFLSWHVEANGLIVHANHCMPCLVRAAALGSDIDIGIDPIDGRFLSNRGIRPEQIALPQSAEMGLLDISNNPLVTQELRRNTKFDSGIIAAWLWCYSDTLREHYFKHEFHYAIDPQSPEYLKARDIANTTVGEIMRRLRELEASV